MQIIRPIRLTRGSNCYSSQFGLKSTDRQLVIHCNVF